MTYILILLLRPFLLILMAGYATLACAAIEQQQPASILKAVEHFVKNETAGLPGKVSIHVSPIDSRVSLPACPLLQPFMPAGSRLWGQTSVGVRCNGEESWTIYVQVNVRVTADVIYLVRPVSQGQIINASDIILQRTDLSRLPSGILTESSQATGKITLANLASGQPLRHDLLRSPPVILQGQTVKLQVDGRGFSVSSEGKALATAAEGQVIQVRIPSGQIISGIAHHGGIVRIHL